MGHEKYQKPDVQPDVNRAVVDFWNERPDLNVGEGELPVNPPIGYVAAKKRPGGKSVLVAGTDRQADWPVLEPVWNGLIRWLKTQGWLDSETPVQGEECFEWLFNGLPYEFAEAAWEYSQLQMRTTDVIFPPFYGRQDIQVPDTSDPTVRVHFETEFEGTPAKFANTMWQIALDLGKLDLGGTRPGASAFCVFVEPIGLVIVEPDPPNLLKMPDLPPGTQRVRVKFFGPEKTVPAQLGNIVTNAGAFITAEMIAGERAFLTVDATDKDWPDVEDRWNMILAKLVRKGYIPPQPLPGAPALPTSGAGGGQGTLARLRKQIEDSFGDEELHTLCFDIGVDYENLPAHGKADKARELVVYLNRRGRISDLIAKCSELRPNVSWEDKPE